MEITLSEPTRLERKGAPPPPAASMGFRAFNAIDRFPPNPAGTANMMMARAPIKSYFCQHYRQIQRKLHTGTVATGVMSRQRAPRGMKVSALVYGNRLNR